jgi:tRNA dimethylallyltransferase
MGCNLPLMVVVLGPTASGKTALGIALAQRLGCRVLSVDSRQIYRGMDIGTAKPTADEQRQAVHELLDLSNPDQPLNLQQFCARATPLINAEQQAGRPALLVGGSGLYLQALCQGLRPPALPPQPWLRHQLGQLGQTQCHQLLQGADPQAAQRIHPADAVRTQRALEVLYGMGSTLSAQAGRTPPAGRVLELGLNPTDLRERIARRTGELYQRGLVGETARLREQYGPELPLLQTIGYQEALGVLEGRRSATEAEALTERRTWLFAKRQRTWFRHRHQPRWLNPESALDEAMAEIESIKA